jgi:phage terminase small subunit
MPAGRPPKPTALKVLHGDRADRINTREPVPDAQPVEPPFKLTQAAQRVWDRLAPDRISKGVLTAWDVDAFAEFCEAVVILRAKRRASKARPAPGQASPMSEYRAALGIVSSLGSRFGWTPADRSRLVMPGEPDAEGEDLLAG